MSGAFGSSQWMYASGAAVGYTINQSLRFDDPNNAYLLNNTDAGDRQIWTWSAWVKKTTNGTLQALFSEGSSSSSHATYFGTDDTILTQERNGGSNRYVNKTSATFQNVDEWLHICYAVDTTQATDSDRIKLYVNGVLQTLVNVAASTYPSLNLNTNMNLGGNHFIGYAATNANSCFDGLMAELHFVDGTQYAATDFGEDVDGDWVPKEFTGSHGTRGYYLNFSTDSFTDNASDPDVFADQAGSRDFNAYVFAASDIVIDSPNVNFATFDPLDQSGTTLTYSQGNLKAERTSSGFAQAYSTLSFSSGKWYAEFLLDTGNSGVGVIAGTTNAGANRYLGQDSFTYSYYFNGNKVNNATYTSYGDSYTTAADGSGDVIGVYINADDGDIYFSKNGTVQNSGTAAFTGVTGPFRFAIASESNCFHIANFGQDDTFSGLKTSGSAAASDDNEVGIFYDAIGLSGYLAPCDSNL